MLGETPRGAERAGLACKLAGTILEHPVPFLRMICAGGRRAKEGWVRVKSQDEIGLRPPNIPTWIPTTSFELLYSRKGQGATREGETLSDAAWEEVTAGSACTGAALTVKQNTGARDEDDRTPSAGTNGSGNSAPMPVEVLGKLCSSAADCERTVRC